MQYTSSDNDWETEIIFPARHENYWLPVTQLASYPTGNPGTFAVGKAPVVRRWLFVST